MIGVKRPILLDIPESFETKRLVIRAPRTGDGKVMNEALVESIDSLKRWLPMPWTQNIQTVADTEELVRGWVGKWILREDLRLSLFRKTDNLYVGQCGLHRIDWEVMRFEIGYWVRTSLEGQGYISEAVVGVTAFAFDVLGAERIELRCESVNDRSAAVAHRAGYHLDGTLRNSDATANKRELRDMLVFSMLRREYLERKEYQTEK